MKTAGSTVQIDVDALKVGMFIHLDMGWMSHPFPLSSFRIGSAEQIGIIRSLGIKRVRWSPEQSALADAERDAAQPGLDRGAPPPQLPPAAEASAAASVHADGADAGDAAARRARREALAAQRASLALCERQFGEATHETRQITDLVAARPEEARERTQALTRALIDKLAGSGEICIRLLTEGAGDKSAAHAVNVAVVSLLMGRSLCLGEPDLVDLGTGALLHDIGKIDLPQRVRHRDEHFSAAEAKFYEEHVTHGVTHALNMGLTPGATLVIAQHHEHCDGTGFPLRLGAERMTTASAIVALIDRYDNLCNPPVPAKALTPHEALSLLFAQGRHKYDAAVLGAFIKMMGVYPPGSVVQLTDDRFAIVAAVNSSRPLKPRVLVHDRRLPGDELDVIDLDRTPRLGIRRSLRAAALPRDAIDCLAPRQRVAYFFEPVREGTWE